MIRAMRAIGAVVCAWATACVPARWRRSRVRLSGVVLDSLGARVAGRGRDVERRRRRDRRYEERRRGRVHVPESRPGPISGDRDRARLPAAYERTRLCGTRHPGQRGGRPRGRAAPAGYRRDRGSRWSPAVTDRRAGHRDRQRDARRLEQARRARSAAPRAWRPDRAGGSARWWDLTLPARRQFQFHQGPRRRDAGQRHWWRIRLLATRHRWCRSHRGTASDQQRRLRQRCVDRCREHHHAPWIVSRAGVSVLDRRRQPEHLQELDLARRSGEAVRLLLAGPRTTRPTTTRPTAATTAAPSPAASASRLAAAPT